MPPTPRSKPVHIDVAGREVSAEVVGFVRTIGGYRVKVRWTCPATGEVHTAWVAHEV